MTQQNFVRTFTFSLLFFDLYGNLRIVFMLYLNNIIAFRSFGCFQSLPLSVKYIKEEGKLREICRSSRNKWKSKYVENPRKERYCSALSGSSILRKKIQVDIAVAEFSTFGRTEFDSFRSRDGTQIYYIEILVSIFVLTYSVLY